MPTAVIIDDHEPFRAAARDLLELEGFSVAGQAENGLTGIALVLEQHPDVVLLDVSLPDLSGLVVAERLAAAGSAAAVVLVSNRARGDIAERLARSPAVAFIPKDELSGAVLRDVLAGAV